MTQERLQKILAHAGMAPSRRKAEDLITAGRVTVNGRVAELGESADPDKDAIKLDDKRVLLPDSYQYLLLNKPPGVMSTRSDPEGRPTVMDFVPPALAKLVVPVGRLDYHSEGLLLLTDDGDLAHRVTHPRYGCTKVYEVKVSGTPDNKDLDKIRRGMVLDGYKTRPVKVRRAPAQRGHRPTTENSWLQVELSEGRTRQIRDMFLRIGHSVQRLRRIAVGPLRDDHLAPGEVRELKKHELDRLRKAVGDPEAASGGSKKGWAKKKPKSGRGGGQQRSARKGRGKGGGKTGGRKGGRKGSGRR